MIQELHNLESSERFFMWMWYLDGKPSDQSITKRIVAGIKMKGLQGYCEDVALYFYLNYVDAEIIQTTKHFCIKYKGKFYDSMDRDGVSNLSDLYFYKTLEPTSIIKVVHYNWKEELPSFYHQIAEELKFPLADRIK